MRRPILFITAVCFTCVQSCYAAQPPDGDQSISSSPQQQQPQQEPHQKPADQSLLVNPQQQQPQIKHQRQAIDLQIFPSALLPFDPPFTCIPRSRRLTIDDDVDSVDAVDDLGRSLHRFSLNANNSRDDLNLHNLFSASENKAIASAARVSDQVPLLRASNDPTLESHGTVEESNETKATLNSLLSAMQQVFPEALEHNSTSLKGEERSPLILNAIGQTKVASCVATTLLLTRQNPQNIGTVLCGCIERAQLGEAQCQMVASFSTAIACNGQSRCKSMKPFPYIPPLKESIANLPMRATLPTPKQISQDTIDSEVETYYLAWKSIAILWSEAQIATCKAPSPPPSTIPGWEILYNVKAVEGKPADRGESTAFARMAVRANSADSKLLDVLISMRGTQTLSEWGVDFSYNLVQPNLSFLSGLQLHRGFSGLAIFIWLSVRPALETLQMKGQLGLITVTGHSLGAGVAAVLSLILAENFPLPLPGGQPRIRLVAFAPPRAGDFSFAYELANKVVTRAIMSEFDPVPIIPCDVTPGCPSNVVPIPTANDLNTNYKFAKYKGVVNILASDLSPFFSTQKFAILRIVSWHICAYDCWTSMMADDKHLSSCTAAACYGQI